MIVATREAPPFAFKDSSGHWQGISIDLWKQIANQMKLHYRFEPASLSGMIDGVASGKFDASVAAMTITAKREGVVDFTEPFYTTGFGIAVPDRGAGWFGIIRSVFSWQFFQAVFALATVLMLVGFLTWLFERRRNPADFGGPWWRGLGSAFWFSAVTMTTVGYGDKAPRTVGGRLISLMWMFAAIIIISTFTGMIASALTANRLEGKVQNPSDLVNVRVGSVPKSASDGWLTARHVAFVPYKDVKSGLAALAAGQIDAFVYDKPLLQYLINNESEGRVSLLPGRFGRQDYGIALPQGSPLREPMNQALLRIIQSSAWNDIVFRYLGSGRHSATAAAD
ncbi:MAG TPA: transporter substrate-binding domain-containing protein [Pseudolabrys sp.]|nr:transporter substrate-binding domain-containing protein [Pseudolabrys sp.]